MMERIACCTDFSENSQMAFEMALDLAEKYGAKLYVVHVVPQVVNPLLSDEELDISVQPDKTLILSLEERMQQEYGGRAGAPADLQFVVLDGHVSSAILSFLEEKGVDLAVMGAYGQSGMGLVLFGSVAKRVAHKAPCSVVIVREREKGGQSGK